MTHTPTPWIHEGERYVATVATRSTVARTALEADADFIVKAVNNHEALLADAKRYSDLAGQFGTELMAAQEMLKKINGQAHAGAMLGGDNAYQACLAIEAMVSRIFETLAARRYKAEADGMREATIEECATTALEQRCQRGTPWDLACTTIAAAIRALAAPSVKTSDQ